MNLLLKRLCDDMCAFTKPEYVRCAEFVLDVVIDKHERIAKHVDGKIRNTTPVPVYA